MMGMLPLLLQSVPFWLDADADDSWLEMYDPTSDPLASATPPDPPQPWNLNQPGHLNHGNFTQCLG